MKKLAIAISIMMIMYPSVSKADLDVLSIVQDSIGGAQERLNLVLKQYTGMQIDLAMLVTDRGAFLENLREQAKAAAIDKAMAVADNIKVGTFNNPGISDKMTTGLYVTPELQNALAANFLKRPKKKVDQFADSLAEQKKYNDMAIENLAALFAEALVHRKQMEKDATTQADGSNQATQSQDEAPENTTALIQSYMKYSREANERWINVMVALAKQMEHTSQIQMAAIKLDELSDITGNTSDDVVDASDPSDPSDQTQQQKGGMSLLSIYNAGKSTYSSIKSGDYAGAFANTAGTALNIKGKESNNVVSSMIAGATAAQNAYRHAEGGNWGGALTDLGQGTGEILIHNGKEGIGTTIIGASGDIGSSVNSAVDGDWGEAVAHAGYGTGGIVSSTSDKDIGAMISAGGALADSSNQIAHGNYGAAYGATDALATMMQGSKNIKAKKADKKEQENSSSESGTEQ